MSLLQAGKVGVCRDQAHPAQPIRLPGPIGTGGPAGAGTFGQLVAAQIPSEALLAYISLLALFSATDGGYLAGRWVLYGLSLPICAAAVASSYFARRPVDAGARTSVRRLPWLPMSTSVCAMAVYGLSVPGSALEASMSGTGFAITAGCLSVGGGLMMSLFAPMLARGNAIRPGSGDATAELGPTAAALAA
jgi:hypothetical protein